MAFQERETKTYKVTIWCGSTNYTKTMFKKRLREREGYALFNRNRSDQIWTTIVDKRNGSNRKHKTKPIDLMFKFHLIKWFNVFTHSPHCRHSASRFVKQTIFQRTEKETETIQQKSTVFSIYTEK